VRIFALLCNIVYCFRRQAEYANTPAQAMEKGEPIGFTDKHNPIVSFIRNLQKNPPEDVKYGEMNDSRNAMNYSVNEFSGSSKTFQSQTVYENRAYVADDGSDYEDANDAETYAFKLSKMQNENR